MTDDTKPKLVIDTPKGPAEVVLTDGQNVTLRAMFPAPPGSPLSGMLRATQHTLRVKIHGCRRIAGNALGSADSVPLPPDHFELCGRWVNLSKEARLVVLGLDRPT